MEIQKKVFETLFMFKILHEAIWLPWKVSWALIKGGVELTDVELTS